MSRSLPIRDNKPCYRDCLIFLLRGEFIIKGQGRVIEMEEVEQRGECLRCTQESRELILAEMDGPRKVRKKAKKLLDEKLHVDALRSSTGKALFGDESASEQCMSVPSFDIFRAKLANLRELKEKKSL